MAAQMTHTPRPPRPCSRFECPYTHKLTHTHTLTHSLTHSHSRTPFQTFIDVTLTKDDTTGFGFSIAGMCMCASALFHTFHTISFTCFPSPHYLSPHPLHLSSLLTSPLPSPHPLSLAQGGVDDRIEEVDTGIYITGIIPGSVAARDGRLFFGDRLAMVNGIPLDHVTHDQAVKVRHAHTLYN